MNGTRLIQSSLRNLVRFKLRSFFMSIGVALGVATLIAGSSVGGGAAVVPLGAFNHPYQVTRIGVHGCGQNMTAWDLTGPQQPRPLGGDPPRTDSALVFARVHRHQCVWACMVVRGHVSA